jgi:hypothetical protein
MWVVCTCGETLERQSGATQVTTIRKGGCGSNICRNRTSRLTQMELIGRVELAVRYALYLVPEVEICNPT